MLINLIYYFLISTKISSKKIYQQFFLFFYFTNCHFLLFLHKIGLWEYKNDIKKREDYIWLAHADLVCLKTQIQVLKKEIQKEDLY